MGRQEHRQGQRLDHKQPRPVYYRPVNGTLQNGVYNRPALGNSGGPRWNGNNNSACTNSAMLARNAHDVNCFNGTDYLCECDENADSYERDDETELDENQRYAIPLYIGGIARICLRDTGNLGSVLISENVVTPSEYIAGKLYT